jgi:hypothetical protein
MQVLPPFVPLSDVVELSIDDRYTDVLDYVEERQEHLRDAREALLGSRVRLQVQRRELQKTREKAASKAGAAFNCLRQYLIGLGRDPPSEIESALSEAEALRNTLGEQEVEYDEAEKIYNLEEWRYTAEEIRFIDELPRGAPAPTQPDKSNPPNAKYEDVARISFGAQDIANIVAESEGHPYLPSGRTSEPMEIEDETGEAQTTMLRYAHHHVPSFQPPHSGHLQSSIGTQLLAEKLDQPRLKWARTRRYIDEWFLHSLETSRLEKTRLRSSMEECELSEGEWWSLVLRHWIPVTAEENLFHTGDTTVSDETQSERLSSNTTYMLRVHETPEHATEQFLVHPHTPDRVLDAPETLEFPTSIEPRDLIDTSPRHTENLDRSPSNQSGYLNPTMLIQQSYSLRYSSNSAISEAQSSTQCERDGTIQQNRGLHEMTPSIRKNCPDNFDHCLLAENPGARKASIED